MTHQYSNNKHFITGHNSRRQHGGEIGAGERSGVWGQNHPAFESPNDYDYLQGQRMQSSLTSLQNEKVILGGTTDPTGFSACSIQPLNAHAGKGMMHDLQHS
jgi:hypothetical protein